MIHTESAAAALALTLLEGQEPRRSHVAGVGELAESIAVLNPGVVPRCVVASAWLHDIGYSPSAKDTGFHPIDGARYLKQRSWPSEVCALVAFHTGAEMEAMERGMSDAFTLFQRPASEDLDLLTMFDLFVDPEGNRTTPEARVDEILRRYRPESPVHRAVARSRSQLLTAAGRAQERIIRWA